MNVCVYCGSQSGNHPAYTQAARHIGETIAEQKWGLVYGGGAVGLMGTVARAALDGGAHVTGIIPSFLATAEVALTDCTELIEVHSMHARKQLMIQRSDIIVALPGGYGTMDELFEAITWKQLGLHDLPIAVLNEHGYYSHLDAALNAFVRAEFVRPQHADLYQFFSCTTDLIEFLRLQVR